MSSILLAVGDIRFISPKNSPLIVQQGTSSSEKSVGVEVLLSEVIWRS